LSAYVSNPRVALLLAKVATQLAPVAASVRILELHGLPEGGDVSDWIDDGGTESDLETLADDTPLYEPSDPVRRFRFPLMRFDAIALTTAVRCIVEDLVPRESLVVCWGPPKCGKSFWIFDLVMHVARGCEYRAKAVEQGTVVYIAAEGELGIKARAHAYRQARMAETGEDPPFYLLTTRLDLVEDIDELIADIKAQLPMSSA
jgi:AAA domain